MWGVDRVMEGLTAPSGTTHLIIPLYLCSVLTGPETHGSQRKRFMHSLTETLQQTLVFGSYLFSTFHFSPSIVKFSLFFFCTWRKHTFSVTKYTQDQSDKLNAAAFKNTHTLVKIIQPCSRHHQSVWALRTGLLTLWVALPSPPQSVGTANRCTHTHAVSIKAANASLFCVYVTLRVKMCEVKRQCNSV